MDSHEQIVGREIATIMHFAFLPKFCLSLFL